MAAGHTCTVDTSLPFDLPALQGFDGIFLAGKVNEGIPDNTVLIQYVENGGHVYLAGGTGEFRDTSEEAAAWNTFLNHFGLGFEGAAYNGVGGTLPIRSSHPIFVGVRSLYQDNGNDISTLDPTHPCQVLVSSGGHGLYAACSGFPPDPAAVAPPLNPSVVTDLATATEFLYTGTNPIQTGVAAGTIEARRVAVLRGRVMTQDGTPLPGVTITILNHPEFGRTLSRADGMFDLAVNGGGPLRVDYAKSGFLPAQRQVQVPWQDFAWLPDAVLVPLDPVVNAIDLTSSAPMQVARGSVTTDADGTRQATVLFPQGTRAQMVSPSGLQRPTSLSVRATEYTVGSSGPQAMPAELPSTSAYTYAVELTVDEALAAGATEVRFNQPLPFYVENFLNFPVGGAVPTGFYDRGKGQWVASDDGRIIRILSVTNGLADLDIDGSNTAASAGALAALGVTDAERAQLAALYPSGQSLWRVPITHFSTPDCNWPAVAPDAEPPGQPNPGQPIESTTCEVPGSIIECENQILGERIGITGTTFSLNYRSGRVPGRVGKTLEISLSGASIPASLKRIDLDLLVAGQRLAESFPAAPNQRTTFTWDGRDAYGRTVQGNQPVTIRLGYVYDVFYQSPVGRARSFALFGEAVLPVAGRQEAIFWQELQAPVAGWDARAQGLAGWMFDVHHTYDPFGQVLRLGDGRRRSAADVAPAVITTVTQVSTGAPQGLAVTPDGSLYISHILGSGIIRMGPDGSIVTVASRTQVNAPLGLAPGPGGIEEVIVFDPETGRTRTVQQPRPILYIADSGNQRILALITAGGSFFTIHVAGSGTRGFNGDDIPATSAHLDTPQAVAWGRDGTLFIADSGNHRVRRVGPDGIITTVAGTGTPGFSGDGGRATQAQLNFPVGLALGPDGSLYIADSNNHRIRRVRPDGTITTVAGTGVPGFNGDGGLATGAQLRFPLLVEASMDGTLFIADNGNARVRQVRPDGSIITVAGTGTPGFSGDGGPATQAQVSNPTGLALSTDGNLYIVDSNNRRVRRIASPLPGSSTSNILISAEDGRELYEFSGAGQHLRTIHALTGATLYRFAYDPAGRLASVMDGDGNVTTIERDANGNPTAIVAPFGQRTTLILDDNGYLASVTNPAGEVMRFDYTADGLLTSFTDAKGGVRRYTYDADGRLTRAEDPAGGFLNLDRSSDANGYTVTLRTALGRTRTYRVEDLLNGGRRHVTTFPSGTSSEGLIGLDGSRRLVYADGAVMTLVSGPSPRWGMQAPLAASVTVTTPSGLQLTGTRARTATLTDPSDPLSLTISTDTRRVNGRTYTRVYDAASRAVTNTTPLGRQHVGILDAQGRVVQAQIAGFLPISSIYDQRGHLASSTVGTGPAARTVSLTYNADGYLATVTDPLGRTTSLGYDAAGRVITQTLTDGRQVAASYDAVGNLTAITPPGQSPHFFSYTPMNLPAVYGPPDVGAGSSETRYTYNADQRLTRMARPDGQMVDYGYDGAGRLNTISVPRGQIGYTYDATTGQLAGITAPGPVTLTYAYDAGLLRDETWTGAITGTISRTYEGNLRIRSRRVNGGDTVDFQYDDDSLLVQAGSLGLRRDPQNDLIISTALAGVTDTRGYSDFGEPVSYSAAYGGTEVYTVQYTRDHLGRITQKTETIGGTTDTYAYTYDLAGRLTAVEMNGAPVATYSYDSNSNRERFVGPAGAVDAVYDAQDRLLRNGTTTYTYTANGELLSKTTDNQTTTYRYDALGNLMAVTLPDGTQVDYLVDGRNRRIGKMINGTLAQGFLYENQLRLAAELDGNNNVVSRFVYATRRNVPDYFVKGETTYRIITDYLGSPRLVIDVATGTIVQRLDYDAFGNVVVDTNPGFQPFGFAGGIYNPHTGLMRFGVRDYDAAVGRWTAKDPVGFTAGDTNLYAYVFNDPVNLQDPEGGVPLLVGAAIIGTASFLLGQAAAIPITESVAGMDAARLLPIPFDPDTGAPPGWPGNQPANRWHMRDAYQHCLASCNITRRTLAGFANFVGWCNEAFGDNPPAESAADEYNNSKGREIGQMASSRSDCSKGCLDALFSGQLNTTRN
jgi:RHS repeat-associated protein